MPNTEETPSQVSALTCTHYMKTVHIVLLRVVYIIAAVSYSASPAHYDTSSYRLIPTQTITVIVLQIGKIKISYKIYLNKKINTYTICILCRLFSFTELKLIKLPNTILYMT